MPARRQALAEFAARHGIPVAETQAGKGALAWDHACNVGAIGVTGSSAANALLAEGDLVLALGTRLQDFTTGSGKLVHDHDARLVSVNVARHDAIKRGGLAVRGDLLATLAELAPGLAGWQADAAWRERARALAGEWNMAVDAATRAGAGLPTDAQVLGAVNRALGKGATVVCAAGGLPGELHKLWRCPEPGGYHVEYGYSCMGYEIAGGLGVKMADPDRTVAVLVGDGSYLMMNSEIATSVASGHAAAHRALRQPRLRLHPPAAARDRGRDAQQSLEGVVPGRVAGRLRGACARARRGRADGRRTSRRWKPQSPTARNATRTTVIVIETDPQSSTAAGGAWWNVPVAEVSEDARVRAAHEAWRRAADDDGGDA